MFEYMPVLTSVISTFSRAGLNVVDRSQFKKEKICPFVIGYWNNLLPIFLLFPIVLCTPAANYFTDDIISLPIIYLSILIQVVGYSFSYAFKTLRVTDIAVLSKSADITVPIILAITGYSLISVGFILLLPAVLIAFVLSAGMDVLKKSFQSSAVLVLALTIQGVFAYLIALDESLHRNSWGLLSTAFSVLIWRFIFSGVLLLYKNSPSSTIIFPKRQLSYGGFYLRGFLTTVTQVSFVFAISSNELSVVWPILNTTGLIGAIFAYLFLGERFSRSDFLFVSFAFLITVVAITELDYEKF
jgi:EamA-like transporter family